IGLNNINIEKEELCKLKKCKEDLRLRLTVLMYIMGNKNESTKILDILKYSNKIKDNCKLLLNYIDEGIDINKLNIKIYLNKIGKDNLKDTVYLKSILEKCLEKYDEDNYIYRINKNIDEIETNKECYCLHDLKINGKDLQLMGYKGKDIGIKLNEILHIVMEYPNLNNKENIIKLLKSV
ncbi:MAG: hypothetical protein ACRC1Y_04690, partial [Paraclostridium sp.]